MDLPKQYDPAAASAKWAPVWDEAGVANADPPESLGVSPITGEAQAAPQGSEPKPPHAVMIPLPNVTGALHMGHALNGTVQDLVTRWRRMQGFEALWQPGTDHAGIATQAVVERRMLEEEGLTRHDVGREALVNRIWAWKETYEGRILGQLKSLGASADFRRTRFTLDDMCSRAVRAAFFKLFSDGLIYRGKRLVNWDTHLQTAVADDEVFEEETQGNFWTFHYPVVNEAGEDTKKSIQFSTTRPETMLGDVAVCVHPSDERYTALVGERVRVPLTGRLVPIIADALLADPEKGTGAVKVTPAHDPNDYACGLRNGLEMLNVLNPDGTMNAEAGEYEGLDRLEARGKIVEAMDALGFYDGVEDRVIQLKHSDRSKTPVEPLLSDQWFVRMGPSEDGSDDVDLAQSAIDAVEDGSVRFYPSRYKKTFTDWLGEKRDWCISRQLWWGHRIPIWSKTWDATEYDEKFAKGWTENPDEDGVVAVQTVRDEDAGTVTVLICIADDAEETERGYETAGFERDPDVLDTWFSSALWPLETLGWPEDTPDLQYFYPTGVLVTSRDIITLWVARMVLFGKYLRGDVPFQHVYIHPKILDGFGRTMSKSKGNGVDPLELVEKYGADAVRFTIASFAGETQDVRLPVSYEHPETGEIVQQTQAHTEAKPEQADDGTLLKPTVHFPKAKKDLQYVTPSYEPDPGVPVARVVADRFEYGRNFCNKIYNASRFAIFNLEGYTPGPVDAAALQLEDRWILSRLARVTEEITTLLGRYQLDAATRALRGFVWDEFCDWYVEMVKPRLRLEEGAEQTDERAAAQRVLVHVLDSILRLLHPWAPFVTEEVWATLKAIAPERGLPEPVAAADLCALASWPEANAEDVDESLEARFDALKEVVVAVRNVRGVYNLPPAAPLALHLRSAEDFAGDLGAVAEQFDQLARVVLAKAGAEVTRPPASAAFSLSSGGADGGPAEGFIPLGDVIDLDAERERQQAEAEKLRGHITGHEKKLSNENFVARAPAEVVEGVRETLATLKAQLAAAESVLAELR
ncbi:valine--tRNA ligase [Alienimonas chondri]|uniref:Valine--tRNA ligase n=1 Tax=Alienimonas chondri TaxID=2681879 RepID=A0ABX1VJ36_9PLAN|nr:valine--tRNA ligase [Alienimonas chondri]NNJ27471.1 Valine--tRNA ligase [Alienimonas chondri]